jgi:hypothetical protein
VLRDVLSLSDLSANEPGSAGATRVCVVSGVTSEGVGVSGRADADRWPAAVTEWAA